MDDNQNTLQLRHKNSLLPSLQIMDPRETILFSPRKKTPVNHIICFIRCHINIISFTILYYNMHSSGRIQYFPRE